MVTKNKFSLRDNKFSIFVRIYWKVKLIFNTVKYKPIILLYIKYRFRK